MRTLALSLAAVVLITAGDVRADDDRRLREWVDADGVVHLTVGPSAKARKAAARLSVQARAGKAAKVRETSEWDLHIAEAARLFQLPQELIRAVIVAESNFDPAAVSHAGAQGLMQLMPQTALEVFVDDPFDPVQNIFGGARYLRILANSFDGDLVRTIAAYNAGPGAVKKHGGIPPYKETQTYVQRVLKFYRLYKNVE